MLAICLPEKHFHATDYVKYQSLSGPRKNFSRKPISSEEKGNLKSRVGLLGWRLALATQGHTRGLFPCARRPSCLDQLFCGRENWFSDHSSKFEFYNNRSALIEFIPKEEGQLYHAGKDPSASCK